MRRREPLSPAAAHELAALEAALAGDPVPAEQAELAQLATRLVAERPQPSAAFADALDARVAERFAGPASSRAGAGAHAGSHADPTRRRTPLRAHRRRLLPALAATAAALLVGLVVALGTGGAPQDSRKAGLPSAAPAIARGPASTAAAGSTSSAVSGAAGKMKALPPGGPAAQQDELLPAPLTAAGRSSGRKVEQSSALTLGTPATRLGDVAQEALGVADRLGGIVDRSSVTSAGPAAGAHLELRFPSAQLASALADLSGLPHAHVLARTDDSQDVNPTYVSTRRRLANARAERDGLLRALRNAGTEQEATAARTRLAVVDRTIASAERAQRALARRVDFSRVTLDVQPQRAGTSTGTGSGGRPFTPGRALRDAGRVLAITAGVVVIAAAALVPLAVLVALTWPAARLLRRRRREQALDGV